ncbi:hypothetical protein [Nonomuraea sp. C10]|uniref:hypothetical protein n=1 Tax=Nonomuraea sp. C10 TaxID=2600577 RepID=UPI0021C3F791|nr:hypothetical protein [Nonomuraea sp. C10]
MASACASRTAVRRRSSGATEPARACWSSRCARGAILWDGADIRDVPATELRARIGAAFQDFVAYDFSAADNLAVGDLSAANSPARIEEATRRAGVHDVLVSLPHGYDTLLTRIFAGTFPEEDPQVGAML